RIAGALRWVWEMRGYLNEGVSWLSKLLAMSSDVSPLVHAKALDRAAELAGQLAYEPQATLWAQEALSLARLTRDRWSLAWALSTTAYFTEPDTDRAAVMLEESLLLFRELNDAPGLSHTFRRLAGCAIDQHNYAYAANLLEQALAGDRLAGDKNATAWDLCFMGVTLWSQNHQPEQVIPLYQESVKLFREIKDVRGVAHPLEMLAEVERVQGHLAQSRALFQETLRLEQELGIRDNLAIFALAGIASIAAAQGKQDWAARLLGAVNVALESGSYNTRIATLVDMFDTALAAVRPQLGDEAFNAAWAVGNSMSLEQAIKEALQDVALEDDLSHEETNQTLVERISPREFDVLHLLGDGCSNAEIAQKLFISVATVKVHTRSIYGKLNVSNRTQAILQAQKLNLL
ncbi:MAG: response regulator transcription factor, partial [Chloroflexota bacterium]